MAAMFELFILLAQSGSRYHVRWSHHLLGKFCNEESSAFVYLEDCNPGYQLGFVGGCVAAIGSANCETERELKCYNR